MISKAGNKYIKGGRRGVGRNGKLRINKLIHTHGAKANPPKEKIENIEI